MYLYNLGILLGVGWREELLDDCFGKAGKSVPEFHKQIILGIMYFAQSNSSWLVC